MDAIANMGAYGSSEVLFQFTWSAWLHAFDFDQTTLGFQTCKRAHVERKLASSSARFEKSFESGRKASMRASSSLGPGSVTAAIIQVDLTWVPHWTNFVGLAAGRYGWVIVAICKEHEWKAFARPLESTQLPRTGARQRIVCCVLVECSPTIQLAGGRRGLLDVKVPREPTASVTTFWRSEAIDLERSNQFFCPFYHCCATEFLLWWLHWEVLWAKFWHWT